MQLYISRRGTVLSLLTITFTFALAQYLQHALNKPADAQVLLEQLPMQLGDWHGEDSEKLDIQSQDILKLDSYVRRLYTNSKHQSVFVYVGYWRRQSGEHQAAKHSPLMCLPANGWKISQPTATQFEPGLVSASETEPAKSMQAGDSQNASAPVTSLNASRLVATIRGDTSLFYYWFFSGEETYRDESQALLRIMRETVMHGRSDGGIVEVTTNLPTGVKVAAQGAEAIDPDTAEKQADAVLVSFMKDFYPALTLLIHGGAPGLPVPAL